MTPQSFLAAPLRPAAAFLAAATGIPCDGAVLCQILATDLYETGLTTHTQEPIGYAHGYGQTQRPTVQLLLDHATCGPALRSVCDARGVEPTADAIFAALLTDDILGFCCTRLLYWADPHPVPAIGNVDAGWACYLRAQRPGKPDQVRWERVYPVAVACFVAQEAAI
jgi:hypothetical protein